MKGKEILMFRKILIVAMFATAAGYCFAAESPLPQVVTSEVYYTTKTETAQNAYQQNDAQYQRVDTAVPAWPLVGSDADIEVTCDGSACANAGKSDDNIKIVSKVGADLIVENNINLGSRNGFGGWSGGANMLHGNQIPVGFDDECYGGEMPLLHREVLEDDGGDVLAVSRSGRKNCSKYMDAYTDFMTKNGMTLNEYGNLVDENGNECDSNGEPVVESGFQDITVDVAFDADAPVKAADQVRSWVVANGQTLHQVLQDWCDKEGWDLVWATSREYPIEASAVFRGRFVDVASAVVRNFSRANPIPYAKFYKGNLVLVVSTQEE